MSLNKPELLRKKVIEACNKIAKDKNIDISETAILFSFWNENEERKEHQDKKGKLIFCKVAGTKKDAFWHLHDIIGHNFYNLIIRKFIVKSLREYARLNQLELHQVHVRLGVIKDEDHNQDIFIVVKNDFGEVLKEIDYKEEFKD